MPGTMIKVRIIAEMLELEHGAWCPTCLSHSATVAHLVTLDTPRMLSVDVPYCPQCQPGGT